MKRLTKYIILSAIILHPLSSHASPEPTAIIDAVVASVDGNPVTLSEVQKRIKRRLSLRELSEDSEGRSAIDQIILEHLIKAEAEKGRIAVSNQEIDDYMDEVAKRNSLTKETFLQALAKEGTDPKDYRRQIELDILKSRLTAQQVRASIAVSDDDIDKYIKDHPNEFSTGSKITLRQIVLLKEKHGSEEAKKLVKQIRSELEDGEDFEDLAEKYSESSEAKDGGLLGEVADKDLSTDIFDAVLSLDEGDVSKTVVTQSGYHIFQVESRDKGDSNKIPDSKREEVRLTLERKMMQEKLSNFFSEKLFKEHAVERKI